MTWLILVQLKKNCTVTATEVRSTIKGPTLNILKDIAMFKIYSIWDRRGQMSETAGTLALSS